MTWSDETQAIEEIRSGTKKTWGESAALPARVRRCTEMLQTGGRLVRWRAVV